MLTYCANSMLVECYHAIDYGFTNQYLPSVISADTHLVVNAN